MTTAFVSPFCNNITISGQVASGATTLSKALAKKLNWKLINGGEMVRLYVREKGIPLEMTTKTPDEYHLKLDKFIKEKLSSGNNFIIESWLSGFDGQNIPGVFKILVVCLNENVRITRVANRDKVSEKQAKKHIETREKENLKKWEKLYKTNDFWNEKNYDLVIDTETNSAEETLGITLKAIGYTSSN